MARTTKAEILLKKRLAEKKRYENIKNDPVKWQMQKEKERLKYLKKKENKKVKPISEKTTREQRICRKNWRKNTNNYRQKLKKQKEIQQFMINNSPPASSDEDEGIEQAQVPAALEAQLVPGEQVVQVNVTPQHKTGLKIAAKNRKIRATEKKNLKLKIKQLNTKLEKYKKRISRLKHDLKTKNKNKDSPNSKVQIMLSNSGRNSAEVKRNLLFGEVLKKQLITNYNSTNSDKYKQMFTKLLCGKIIKKYRMQNQCSKFLSYKRTTSLRFKGANLRYDRKNRSDSFSRESVERFLELDLHSRICPGKKDFVRCGKIIKQKRYLNDTLKNLYRKFLQTFPNMNVSYSFFCKSCPFWVKHMRANERETCKCITHANFEFLVSSLNLNNILEEKTTSQVVNSICCSKDSKCLLRMCLACQSFNVSLKEYDGQNEAYYLKWQTTKEEIFDKKSNKKIIIGKMEKKKITCQIQKIVREFEKHLPLFLRHEGTNIHQFTEIKNLKDRLEEKEAVIHMDFSENYAVKYAEEVQSFHFGGSRKQITMHTVVVYTKEQEHLKVQSYCTMSESLSHNVFAIWAHLIPILDEIAACGNITTLHFVSDSPATQYRNKTMFYFLIKKLKIFYPALDKFTWNYSESGHGKGAPDGIGGTCKRTADRIVAQGSDLVEYSTLFQKLQENCPGIKFFSISTVQIESMEKLVDGDILPFAGTMKVHQVEGKSDLDYLKMRSLSCFDCGYCDHNQVGLLRYNDEEMNSTTDSLCLNQTENHSQKTLNYMDVYSSSSSDDECIAQNAANTATNITNGMFVLAEFVSGEGTKNIKKYRYVAVCGHSEDDEIQITSLRSTGKGLFKLDENDVSHIGKEQIITILPTPVLVLNGNRVNYKFPEKIDVLEKL